MCTRKLFVRQHIQVETESLTYYNSDLQMYETPPSGNITAEEFEKLALERLKLLKILENAQQLGHKRYSDSWKSQIHLELKRNNLDDYISLLGFTKTKVSQKARRADHISHWILCLVIGLQQELHEWFMTRELELFKMRCDTLSNHDQLRFLDDNNFKYTLLSHKEKNLLKQKLLQCTRKLQCFEETDFYTVPFTKVRSLIKNRNVYVNKGIAYIPDFALSALACDGFHVQLGELLSAIKTCCSYANNSPVSYLIDNIQNTIPRRGYVTEKNTCATTKNLDKLSKIHYPLCMRTLHDQLRMNHHLKHGSRVQYGVFIKEIGISVEDAITFWREEFTKIMSTDHFDRHYLYYIRYTYGLEGCRKARKGFSCSRLIANNPTTTDRHGCPFKHWNKQELTKKLSDYGLSQPNVNAIVDLASKRLYQAACAKYFDSTHSEPSVSEIYHPNQYYNESVMQSNSIPDIEDIFGDEDDVLVPEFDDDIPDVVLIDDE